MMSKLESFFRQNKAGFDRLEVDADVWQGIASQLDLPVVKAPTSVVRRLKWLAAAAAVALMLMVFSPSNEKATPLAVVEGLEVNDFFPDISLRNPEGELVPLSTLKGKIVLVEFWASYSKVCTDDHCYFFKPAYNTYKDKGFEIYAISVDSSAASWLQAIERDELDWVQVADLNGSQSPLNASFGIHSLPTTFLLDAEGRILAKDIEANELAHTLDQLFVYH